MTARCALRIMGCPENFLESLITPSRPRLLFAKFLIYIYSSSIQQKWVFVLIEAINVRTKFEVRSFTRP